MHKRLWAIHINRFWSRVKLGGRGISMWECLWEIYSKSSALPVENGEKQSDREANAKRLDKQATDKRFYMTGRVCSTRIKYAIPFNQDQLIYGALLWA